MSSNPAPVLPTLPIMRSLLLAALLLVPAPTPSGLLAQRLQPADGRPRNEIRATGDVTLVAEVFLRGPRRRDGETAWLEVRGEIRSGESDPVVVETGRCPVVLVAYKDRERTRAVWTGRATVLRSTRRPAGPSSAGCPTPDPRIRHEVTPGRGHLFVQRFPLGGTQAEDPPPGALHLSVISRVNGVRRSWDAGSLTVERKGGRNE